MTYEATALSDLETRYPGFSSFKTDAPIHYPRRWHRDALIQATLDRAVTRISPIRQQPLCKTEGLMFSFLLFRGDSPSLVAVTEADLVLPLPSTAEQWSRRHLVTEPRLTTGRTIWRHKHIVPSAAEQLYLQQAVLQGGPQTIMSLMLLLDCARDEKAAKVMSLIANGIFEIEMDLGLRPDSRIWMGPIGRMAKAARRGIFSNAPGQLRDIFTLKAIAHARHSSVRIKNSRPSKNAAGTSTNGN